MTTIRELVDHWRRAFEQSGVDSPRLTAELIAAFALGVDRGTVIGSLDRTLAADEVERIVALCQRRAAREPLAYITGEREFYSRSFRVTPGVLIPRPETELIIDLAKRQLPADQSGMAADVGCGSGCLAVTLAVEFPRLRIIAVDLSMIALACTHANAVRLGVASRVHCVRGDLLSCVAGPLVLCVSNPPYVDPADAADLQPEVREFEPHLALFSPENGLLIPKQLLSQAASRLAPGARLLLEFGAGQAEPLSRFARESGLSDLQVVEDMTGLPRMLSAERA